MRSRIEEALMIVYQQGNRLLATPDITSQLEDIENVHLMTTSQLKVYHADWLNGERVTIKALKMVRYDALTDKVRLYFLFFLPGAISIEALHSALSTTCTSFLFC